MQKKISSILWGLRQRVIRFISSILETEELGFVAEVGPEIEVRRAMNATEKEHNSLCVVCSPDDGLQVFRSEVDAVKVNFFFCARCCLRERVNVEPGFYADVTVCKIIDSKQL